MLQPDQQDSALSAQRVLLCFALKYETSGKCNSLKILFEPYVRVGACTKFLKTNTETTGVVLTPKQNGFKLLHFSHTEGQSWHCNSLFDKFPVRQPTASTLPVAFVKATGEHHANQLPMYWCWRDFNHDHLMQLARMIATGSTGDWKTLKVYRNRESLCFHDLLPFGGKRSSMQQCRAHHLQ